MFVAFFSTSSRKDYQVIHPIDFAPFAAGLNNNLHMTHNTGFSSAFFIRWLSQQLFRPRVQVQVICQGLTIFITYSPFGPTFCGVFLGLGSNEVTTKFDNRNQRDPYQFYCFSKYLESTALKRKWKHNLITNQQYASHFSFFSKDLYSTIELINNDDSRNSINHFCYIVEVSPNFVQRLIAYQHV